MNEFDFDCKFCDVTAMIAFEVFGDDSSESGSVQGSKDSEKR